MKRTSPVAKTASRTEQKLRCGADLSHRRPHLLSTAPGAHPPSTRRLEQPCSKLKLIPTSQPIPPDGAIVRASRLEGTQCETVYDTGSILKLWGFLTSPS